MPSQKKRAGLGKGLNALMQEAQYETGNHGSDTKIPITEIHPNPNQRKKCSKAQRNLKYRLFHMLWEKAKELW